MWLQGMFTSGSRPANLTLVVTVTLCICELGMAGDVLDHGLRETVGNSNVSVISILSRVNFHVIKT